MRISSVARLAAMFAMGVVAGCSGPVRQSVLPLAARPSGMAARSAPHSVAWIGDGDGRRALLYVSNFNGTVSVYRYADRKLVNVLTQFADPKGECTDAAGDVYITDDGTQQIYKYAHGGSKALETLDDSPYDPEGCAVNPSTGDLAVANYGPLYNFEGNIAVYRHGSSAKPPIYYAPGGGAAFSACGYDERGDLLAADYGGLSGYYYGGFYYLPKHAHNLIPMTLSPSKGFEWDRVASIFWDGKYWAVGNYHSLYRFTINVKAYYIGSIGLNLGNAYLYQVAMYHSLMKPHDREVVGAAQEGSSDNAGSVDYWNYPAGGSPVGQLTKGLSQPYGVAISPGADE